MKNENKFRNLDIVESLESKPDYNEYLKYIGSLKKNQQWSNTRSIESELVDQSTQQLNNKRDTMPQPIIANLKLTKKPTQRTGVNPIKGNNSSLNVSSITPMNAPNQNASTFYKQPSSQGNVSGNQLSNNFTSNFGRKMKSKMNQERIEKEKQMQQRIQITNEFLSSKAYQKLPVQSPIVVEINSQHFNPSGAQDKSFDARSIEKFHPLIRNNVLIEDQASKQQNSKSQQKVPKFRLELRVFNGRLNETKQQAVKDFEDIYGFKPSQIQQSQTQTPVNAGSSQNVNLFANGMNKDLFSSKDSGGKVEEDRTKTVSIQQNDLQQAQISVQKSHIDTEETSLLNSSYADFHEVFKNLKKRHYQSKANMHNQSTELGGNNGISIMPMTTQGSPRLQNVNGGSLQTPQKSILINRLAYKLISSQKNRPLSMVDFQNKSVFNYSINNTPLKQRSIKDQHEVDLTRIVKQCVQSVQSQRYGKMKNKNKNDSQNIDVDFEEETTKQNYDQNLHHHLPPMISKQATIQKIQSEKARNLIRQDSRFRHIFSGDQGEYKKEIKRKRKGDVIDYEKANEIKIQSGQGGMVGMHIQFNSEKGPLLYSDDSLKRLAINDSLRYQDYDELMKEYKNVSSRSVFLLNSKYKYRRYIEF